MNFTMENYKITAPLHANDSDGRYDYGLASAICDGSQVVTVTAEARSAYHYFKMIDGKPHVSFDLATREPYPKEIQERIDASQKWLSGEISRLSKLRDDIQRIKKTID